MKDVLELLGSVPVTKETVASLYPKVSGANQKVAALVHSGKLLRLKRGLYVVNPQWSEKRINIELVANHIYSPSYISLQTALRWYGLIPERVARIQSMTVKHSRRFENPLGVFDYTCVTRDYFPIGIRQEQTQEGSFIIASPEKALCDLVISTAGVNLRYVSQAREFLEEDLRFEMNAFWNLDKNIFIQCTKAGKKSKSIETIVNLLER
ncbi:MAG: hypothetical protein IJK39_02795 [Bacteroidales bacterium]|nr:hypothetical protein [Bacteroidales bacterium]